MEIIISVTAAIFKPDLVDHLKLDQHTSPSFLTSVPQSNPDSESISLTIPLITQVPSSFHPAEDGEQDRGA